MSSRQAVFKESMPWMKLYLTDFVMDCQGLPLAHVGAYIKLMILYWSQGNKLPDTLPSILRRVGTTADEEGAIQEVLDEFFPMNGEGQRCHAGLDSQLASARDVNSRKGEGMRKVWAERKGTTAASAAAVAATQFDPNDF